MEIHYNILQSLVRDLYLCTTNQTWLTKYVRFSEITTFFSFNFHANSCSKLSYIYVYMCHMQFAKNLIFFYLRKKLLRLKCLCTGIASGCRVALLVICLKTMAPVRNCNANQHNFVGLVYAYISDSLSA